MRERVKVLCPAVKENTNGGPAAPHLSIIKG